MRRRRQAPRPVPARGPVPPLGQLEPLRPRSSTCPRRRRMQGGSRPGTRAPGPAGAPAVMAGPRGSPRRT
eukprot:11174547-Lingulodinium_polyedra.AAC.1